MKKYFVQCTYGTLDETCEKIDAIRYSEITKIFHEDGVMYGEAARPVYASMPLTVIFYVTEESQQAAIAIGGKYVV